MFVYNRLWVVPLVETGKDLRGTSCNDYGIKVTLFHGRGGNIGCGGGPTYPTFWYQPPGFVMVGYV